MPHEVVTAAVMKSDLLDAVDQIANGQALRIMTLPAGAVVLTSSNDIAEQIMFSDRITIRYILATDPPPTVSVGVAGSDDAEHRPVSEGDRPRV